jgi:hypothetical protein
MENKTIQTFRGMALFCFLLLSLSGCATTPKFYVDIDSISSSNADSKKKYVLIPGMKDVKNTDLQFMEFTKYIDNALISRGFIKAKKTEDANIAIFLVYGIGNPQEHTYSYAIPMWGQTGVSSSTTFGNINTFGNIGTYSGTTTYNPTYGVTGYIPATGSYVTYFKFLELDAVDLDEFRKSQKMNQLWKTTVTSSDQSGDLRFVFPIMVAAAKEYLGSNTGQKIQVILTIEDQRVVEIKNLNEKR